MERRPDSGDPPGPFTLRRLRMEDAPGVSALAQRVYGRAYVRGEIYSAVDVARLNQTGEWTSIVAVDGADQVAAHIAIEPSRFGPIAEMGMGMVLPELRRHGLLERLRDAVIEEASRVGLHGYFLEIATDNVAAQGMSNRSTVYPCGISLWLWPKVQEGARTGARQSFIRYVRYLKRPSRVTAYAPAHHADILVRLYAELGVPLDLDPGARLSNGTRSPEEKTARAPGAQGLGRDWEPIVVERFPWCQSTFITVTEATPDTAAQIEAAHRAFAADDAMESAYLELPLAQPHTVEACVRAEQLGFFFAGVTPSGASDGDMLRLQCSKQRGPVSEPGIAHPFARELCDYIARAAAR